MSSEAVQASEEDGTSTDSTQIDYLHLVTGGNDVLVHPSEIREILRPLPLTILPMGPGHLLGLANIRGQIVCIIDLGKLMAVSAGDRGADNRTRILVLRNPSMHVGIQVDEVRGLYRVNEAALNAEEGHEQIEPGLSSVEIDGRTFNLLHCAKLLSIA